MVSIYRNLVDLSFSLLMDVYSESNQKNANEFYSDMDKNAAVLQAEQDFYAFLSDVFFMTEGAQYAVLEERGKYCSAVRVEPYQDGFLISGLETAPSCRRMGYGKELIDNVLSMVNGSVYSHVTKNNIASLRMHKACGFCIIQNSAVYLDGSRGDFAYTLCYRPDSDEIAIDK